MKMNKMKFASRLLHIFVFGILLLSENVHSIIRFTAITDVDRRYLNKLYIQEWNKDPPSEQDPAITDPSVRQKICDEISNSGFLAERGREPVNIKEIYPQLKEARYRDLFHRIYKPTDSTHPDRPSFEYVNPYTLERFDIRSDVPTQKFEYTFVCLVKHRHPQAISNTGSGKTIAHDEASNESTSGDGENRVTDSSKPDHFGGNDYKIVPFYVSKAYGLTRGPHVHRFMFSGDGQFRRVMLAEGSAQVYTRPDFNVELHYLELRKHHQPVAPTSPELDPVCKLNWGGAENSQLFRLCAIVLTASGFKDTIKYAARLHFGHWWYSPIWFRTPEGLKNKAGIVYKELTLECHAQMIGGGSKIFHVSRAYNPNEVFVYTETRGMREAGIYLESLVTNVNIVDELYNFGMVEI